MIVRRLALVFSIVICGSLALAAAAAAAGLGPGQYSFTNTSANAFFGGGKGGPQPALGFSVFVNRGLNSFQPESSDGGGTVTTSTMVQLSWFTATGGGFACYVVPNSDFVVSKSLQSASLHTTLNSTNLCPGFGVPAIGKAAVPPLAVNASQASVAVKGGGGPPPPMTLDVTWSGLGVTSLLHDRSTYKCLDYATESSFTAHASSASAAGNLSMITGSFTTPQAVVGSSDGQININGSLSPSCSFI
jgi:hypothetical protein